MRGGAVLEAARSSQWRLAVEATVTVSDAGGGGFHVVWNDVNLVRGEGSIIFAAGEANLSVEGWQTCTP